MRERDQANANTMQIRSDFEKLLLQSNQVTELEMCAVDNKKQVHFDHLQDSLQLRHQLSSTHNRLNEMESELLHSKKHCLELTEEVNCLVREVSCLFIRMKNNLSLHSYHRI